MSNWERSTRKLSGDDLSAVRSVMVQCSGWKVGSLHRELCQPRLGTAVPGPSPRGKRRGTGERRRMLLPVSTLQRPNTARWDHEQLLLWRQRAFIKPASRGGVISIWPFVLVHSSLLKDTSKEKDTQFKVCRGKKITPWEKPIIR